MKIIYTLLVFIVTINVQAQKPLKYIYQKDDGKLYYHSALSSDGSLIAYSNNSTTYQNSALFFGYRANDKWILTDSIKTDMNKEATIEVVAMSDDGKRIAAGFTNKDILSGTNTNEGSVIVYQNNNGKLSQIGQEIFGTRKDFARYDNIKFSGDGKTMALAKIEQFGKCYVAFYKLDNNIWTQKVSPIIGKYNNDYFGYAMDLDYSGTKMVIGAYNVNFDNKYNVGYSAIYHLSGNEWVEQPIVIKGNNFQSSCGWNVSMTSKGDKVAITSTYDSIDRVRIFVLKNNNWQEEKTNLSSIIGADKLSNAQISKDGKNLFVSQRLESNTGLFSYSINNIYKNNGLDNNWKKKALTYYTSKIEVEVSASFSLNHDASVIAIGAPLEDAIISPLYGGVLLSIIYDKAYGRVYENVHEDLCTYFIDDIERGDLSIDVNNGNSTIDIDENGLFTTSALPKGNYTLKLLTPQNLLDTCQLTYNIYIDSLGQFIDLPEIGFNIEPNLQGRVFEDFNLNCQLDAGEVGIENMIVRIEPGNINVYTDSSGYWKIDKLPKVGTYKYTLNTSPNNISCGNLTETIQLAQIDSSINVGNIPLRNSNYNIQIVAYYDFNENSEYDLDEQVIQDYGINLNDTMLIYANYGNPKIFYTPRGTSKIKFAYNDEWVVSDTSYNEIAIDVPGNPRIYIPLKPRNAKTTPVHYFSSSMAICDSTANATLSSSYFNNVKTKVQTEIIFKNAIVFSFPPYTSKTDSSYIWNFEKNEVNASSTIYFTYLTDETTEENDSTKFEYVVKVKNSANDTLINESRNKYSRILLCSFDPNDKQVDPPGKGEYKQTLKDSPLIYTIRFQNMGNFRARTVVVKDTLSDLLDPTTFKLLSSSHPITQTSLNKNLLSFSFFNINLPPASENEILSNGYINFVIHPKKDIDENSIIANKAAIVFDKNKPIVTNEVMNTMVTEITTTKEIVKSNDVIVFPNPANHVVSVYSLKSKILAVSLIDLNGKLLTTVKDNFDHIALDNMTQGIYIVQILTTNGVVNKLMNKN